MQSPTHTWERLAALDPPVAWRPWLQHHQRTIALCGAIFVAGIAFGAGRPSQKTAVVIRIHHERGDDGPARESRPPLMMELVGLEPTTSTLPAWRSPS